MKFKTNLLSIIIIASLLTVFLTGFSKSAQQEEYTSYIFSDCSVFISEFQPTSNFNSGGKMYYLDVGEDEFTYSYASFVKFDLSSLPEDADILSAQISLYLAANPENIPVKMYRILDSWLEDSVTWSDAPSFKDFSKTQGLVDSVTITSTGRSYWEATNLVTGWFNGSKTNYGVALESTGEYFHRFSSDENTYHKPLLAITYLSGSGEDPGDPPEEPPEDSEPCEISYIISPETPHAGDIVTITATASDNVGLEYLIIKEGSIELSSNYATNNETTTLTCAHTETMYPPGKTFIIEANDKGGSPPQSITLPISVEGSGSAPEIILDIEYRDQNAIPRYHSLLPGDNQMVNVSATATDPDGINLLTITVNGILYDFSFDGEYTSVRETVRVVNDDPALDTFRYSAAATDMEGYYNSTSGDDIEIRTPFQWDWGLNFSNWGCDESHTWSWDMMESIYGDSDIYLDKSKDWKKDWAWRLYESKIREGGRNGFCFGMCTLALELAHSPARITPYEIQDTATHVDALERENWNHTWRYYYARQCGQYSAKVTPRRVAQFLDLYFTDWAASGWTGMHPYLDDLVDTISDELDDGKYGIVSIRNEGSGHAVVPWRIVPGEDTEDITKMYIYDPNHEHVSFNHELDYSNFEYYPYIECNVNSRFSDWWIYQWNSTSIWQDEICYFTYSESIGDVSELNYIDSVDITDHDIPLGISYLVAIGSGDSTYYAMDTSGRKTGMVDGVIISEIPNSGPVIDLQSSNPYDNIMLILPENQELTFYFDTTKENGEYTFSLNNKDSTYSLINKTIIKNKEEKINIIPKENDGDYDFYLTGIGDSEYSIKLTKEYKDEQEKDIAREYTVNKNSTNEKEDVKVTITDDEISIISNNGEEALFDYEVKSTEVVENKDTPGFEVLSLFIVLSIIALIKRKR